jgi:hypothetical protein
VCVCERERERARARARVRLCSRGLGTRPLKAAGCRLFGVFLTTRTHGAETGPQIKRRISFSIPSTPWETVMTRWRGGVVAAQQGPHPGGRSLRSSLSDARTHARARAHTHARTGNGEVELFEIILYMQDKAQYLFQERDAATGELVVDEGARTCDARAHARAPSMTDRGVRAAWIHARTPDLRQSMVFCRVHPVLIQCGNGHVSMSVSVGACASMYLSACTRVQSACGRSLIRSRQRLTSTRTARSQRRSSCAGTASGPCCCARQRPRTN